MKASFKPIFYTAKVLSKLNTITVIFLKRKLLSVNICFDYSEHFYCSLTTVQGPSTSKC